MKKMKMLIVGCLAVLMLAAGVGFIPAGVGDAGIVRADAQAYKTTGKITKAQYNKTTQSNKKRFKVTTNYVRIRTQPSTNNRIGVIIAQLNKGQVVYIPQAKNNAPGSGAWSEGSGHRWTLVKCKKGSSYYQGWVSDKYLKKF